MSNYTPEGFLQQFREMKGGAAEPQLEKLMITGQKFPVYLAKTAVGPAFVYELCSICDENREDISPQFKFQTDPWCQEKISATLASLSVLAASHPSPHDVINLMLTHHFAIAVVTESMLKDPVGREILVSAVVLRMRFINDIMNDVSIEAAQDRLQEYVIRIKEAATTRDVSDDYLTRMFTEEGISRKELLGRSRNLAEFEENGKFWVSGAFFLDPLIASCILHCLGHTIFNGMWADASKEADLYSITNELVKCSNKYGGAKHFQNVMELLKCGGVTKRGIYGIQREIVPDIEKLSPNELRRVTRGLHDIMETNTAYSHGLLSYPNMLSEFYNGEYLVDDTNRHILPTHMMYGGGSTYHNDMSTVFRTLLNIKSKELRMANKRLSDNSWNRVNGLINKFQHLEEELKRNPTNQRLDLKHKQDMTRLKDVINTLYQAS
jgi:hypothetical protein